MILIPRNLIRKFRSVLRQAGFYKGRTPLSAGVRLIFAADGLRMQADNGQVAIQLESTGSYEPADFTVPLSFFSECEGKSLEFVTLRQNDSGKTVATWLEQDVPQQASFPLLEPPEMPEFATARTVNPPGLLEALREAAAIVSPSATRYALDCLLLKGQSGTVVATDSRQLLTTGGFSFPWENDLLIPVCAIFASQELSPRSDVQIGRTESGVTIQVGPWTIHHRINQEGRYPEITKVIPAPKATRTSLRFDETDAAFPLARSEQLPAADLTERPLTLDLNGSATIRARRDDESPTTELALSRSQRVGDELRIGTNRDYLTRALRLGFRSIDFVSSESPCVCREGDRTYIWMPLAKNEVLLPDPEAIRITSAELTQPMPGNPQAEPVRVRHSRKKRPRLDSLSVTHKQPAVDHGLLPRMQALLTQFESTLRALSELLIEASQRDVWPAQALSA